MDLQLAGELALVSRLKPSSSQKIRPDSLIKRFATPEEASLAAYVATPLASATTGAALCVDGGVIRRAF
jgi:NAD(P)-dependent dehydrogenase (short-subunit alcohol dehydrogenase family)